MGAIVGKSPNNMHPWSRGCGGGGGCLQTKKIETHTFTHHITPERLGKLRES